jgi:hypothetical protein
MTTASEDTIALIERYNAAPQRLRAAVRGLDPAALDHAPAPGEWTPRQIILHLVDADLVAAMRIRQLLAEEGPSLPAFDQEAWAARLDHGEGEAVVAAAVELFALLRATTGRLLERAPRERWSAWGQHSVRGRVTLHDTVTVFVRHAEEHVAQLEAAART